MEKNNKTEIFNNLQNTLNLLDKIDLTGGDKLNPDELKKRIDLYIQTKEQILNKIKTIYDKLGIFSNKYNEAMDGWTQSYQQYNEVSKDLNESKNTNTILTGEKEELQNDLNSLNNTNKDLNQQLDNYKTSNTQLQSDNQALNASNETLSNDIQQWDTAYGQLKSENSTLTTKLENMKGIEDDIDTIGSLIVRLANVIRPR